MKYRNPQPRLSYVVLTLVLASLTPNWGSSGEAMAAVTDIAPSPIFTATTASTEVKPNLMFVLDDSGSMAWTYMPDTVGDKFFGKYGYTSSQCNGVYYNPNITYTPPVDSSGNSYGNASFTAAQYDGYNTATGTLSTSTGNGTVDLSSKFQSDMYVPYSANNNNAGLQDSAQAAYYYIYSGTQITNVLTHTDELKNYYDSTSIFYKECISSIGSTTKVDGTHAVNSLFTKKTVSATSGPSNTDERTNFANWYSYYRTRMQMMKTASGQALKALNEHFRVGFMTINANSTNEFLNIADFTTTQKSSWYSKFYAVSPNNSTPLREALAYAGQIYAGKSPTALTNNSISITNPVQYSCQQNYTILSTDGFWNGTDSNVKKLDGTTMDNQDGPLPRPYNDGAASTSTSVTTYTSTQDRQTVTTGAVTTKTWTKFATAVGAACSSTTPPNTASAPMPVDNSSHTAALGYATNDPDNNNNHCYSLGNKAWFCRGSSGNDPAVSLSSVTGTSGPTWYLVSTGASGSGCISANTAWGSGYSSSAGVCPASNVVGNLVTTTPYTKTETISGATTTTVDRYTGTQTSTQITTNGVPGTVGALTPTNPTYSFTLNLSTSQTGATSDTFSAWVAGTPNPNNVCVATASLPSSGDTTPTSTTATSGGTTSNPAVIASSGPTAGTPVVTATSTGGTSDTLADVAAYYYNTNLRTTAMNNCVGVAPDGSATNLCIANKVPPNGLDTATWQHMTTFTLGLGARGKMVFSPTYLNDTSGDYFDVKNGSIAGSRNCSWRDGLTVTGGKCNWPVPASDQPANIDDLWHAAVNGHGNYFSATDPNTLQNALASSLNVIINTPQPGTAAAAATTNPKITSANNFQFSSYFKSVEWSGELIKQTMSLTDGSVPAYDPFNPVASSYVWSAQTLLDTKAATLDTTTTPPSINIRTIYTNTGTVSNGVTASSPALTLFTWANLQNNTTLAAYFKTPNISTSPPAYPVQITGLSQFCSTGTNCLTSSAQSNFTVATSGAAGEALVNYLRGDRSNEEGTVSDTSHYFRHRTHVLGDIVSAQPQYVGPPSKTYTDTGYAAFKTAQTNRAAVVFAAANDGMLHAFDAATGDEKWAYIPSFVLPKLYALADKSYSNKHQYFVEGTPKSSDALINGVWKTILVGGLNGGGTGYYALDVTDPATPVLLWEFTDTNMGYTFGNPEITKLDNGTWVVIVSSGYNNCARSTSAACVTTGGNGNGYLYILDASTGLNVSGSPGSPISTAVSGPSGLSRIIAKAGADNVTTRVYGGDLLGNLWRFTTEVSGSAGFSKQLLATFLDPSGIPQPITARPQVTTLNGVPVVFVGTGRYLGMSDVGNAQQQSFYGVKDNVTTTAYTSIRTDSSFIKKTAVNGTCPTGIAVEICDPGTQVRTVSLNSGTAAADSISSSSKNGWFIDFPANAHEIEFTDPKLVLGTLAFSTSVPVASTSVVCGNPAQPELPAFGYMLDYLSGGAVGTTDVIGSTLGLGIATAPNVIQLPNGEILDVYRLPPGIPVYKKHRFNVGSGTNSTRRVSWRELVTE